MNMRPTTHKTYELFERNSSVDLWSRIYDLGVATNVWADTVSFFTFTNDKKTQGARE